MLKWIQLLLRFVSVWEEGLWHLSPPVILAFGIVMTLLCQILPGLLFLFIYSFHQYHPYYLRVRHIATCWCKWTRYTSPSWIRAWSHSVISYHSNTQKLLTPQRTFVELWNLSNAESFQDQHALSTSSLTCRNETSLARYRLNVTITSHSI